MSVKTITILVFIATILLVFSLGANVALAASGSSGSESLIKPDDIKPEAPTGNEIQSVGGRILGVLQTVGVVLAVIILVVLGIKYMMGSAEEKAEYKKTMIPYLVGAVFIFAAPILANIVYNFVQSLGGNE